MSDEKLHPRNRTARLAQARAAGNPVTTELESGVGNCFPGLEFDVRNVDRRFFPYLVVDFVDSDSGILIELVEVAVDRAEAEGAPTSLVVALKRLATEPGPWGIRGLKGDFAGFGPRDFALGDLGTDENLPADSWTAVRLIRPATEVTVDFRNAADVSVNVSAVRASYLSDDGAFASMFEAGELTQSLCSPWTHDFRDCGCFYWASNHPDLTLPAVPVDVATDDPAWGVRTLWLRSDRQGITPPPAAPVQPSPAIFRRPGEMDYFEINQGWQDLDTVLDGREVRSPYDPHEIAGTPLAPDKVVPTLRYAAGVEVAVLVEYLAAVYSLNITAGTAGSELRDDTRAARQQLLLVAIGEMRHLREVNSVLHELHRRTGVAELFTPALGIATVIKGTAGFPDRGVRFRRLTPDVMDEFVRVEAPSLTIDGLYSSLLATFERDNDDELAATIRSVMADGSEHFATFRAMQEWLSRHDSAEYLRSLKDAPPGDQGVHTLQQRYEDVLDVLFLGYRQGVPAGSNLVNGARSMMLGAQGIDGACEDLALRGFQPAFSVPADPRFAAVPPP